MKKIGLLIFVLLFLFVSNEGYGQQPSPTKPEQKGKERVGPGPLEPGSKEAEKSETPSSVPGMKQEKEMEAGEVFFAAGATSPDGQYVYVVFDRFLLQYASQTLELKKKADLGIPTAPVTPSIATSKDSKYLYVISNGMLFQVNAVTFKVENVKKIAP